MSAASRWTASASRVGSARPGASRKPGATGSHVGLSAAYARHRRNDEDACDVCLERQRQKSAQANAKRRERRAQDDETRDVAPEALTPADVRLEA